MKHDFYDEMISHINRNECMKKLFKKLAIIWHTDAEDEWIGILALELKKLIIHFSNVLLKNIIFQKENFRDTLE